MIIFLVLYLVAMVLLAYYCDYRCKLLHEERQRAFLARFQVPSTPLPAAPVPPLSPGSGAGGRSSSSQVAAECARRAGAL